MVSYTQRMKEAVHLFQLGDRVVYGIHGVCQIVDEEERHIDRKKIRYFVLEPVDQPGARFFVPSENPAALAKLRPVISAEELEALLSSDKIREDRWIADENRRKQRYRELINSGDREELLQMVSTLHRHKHEQLSQGRKFHLCDENFLRDAEKLLNSEFSMVLQIQPSEVSRYIKEALMEER